MLRRVVALASCASLVAGCAPFMLPMQSARLPGPDPAQSSGPADMVSPPASGGTPGTVPASLEPGLVVTPTSRGDLSKFTTFTYDQARSSGLPPEVAAVVDEQLDRSVSKFVDRAVKQQRSAECFDGVEPCASFALTIRQEACQGYLCARVDVEAVPVGSAGSVSDTFVWVFDLLTGQATTLSAAYGPLIGERLQAAARRWQKSRGIRPSDYPVNPADLTGWLPADDGIRVWFPSGSLGPESEGVAMIVMPYDSPEPSPDPSPTRVRWRSITDAPSDPLYVLVKDYRMQPDGSILLTVDPLSPDLAGDEGPWCGTWTFADPPGDWCLTNQRTRERKVTLLPDADVGIGDGIIAVGDLPDYIAAYLSYGNDLQTEPISYLRLDARGFADQFVALGPSTG
jgi:hypothetical protein